MRGSLVRAPPRRPSQSAYLSSSTGRLDLYVPSHVPAASLGARASSSRKTVACRPMSAATTARGPAARPHTQPARASAPPHGEAIAAYRGSDWIFGYQHAALINGLKAAAPTDLQVWARRRRMAARQVALPSKHPARRAAQFARGSARSPSRALDVSAVRVQLRPANQSTDREQMRSWIGSQGRPHGQGAGDHSHVDYEQALACGDGTGSGAAAGVNAGGENRRGDGGCGDESDVLTSVNSLAITPSVVAAAVQDAYRSEATSRLLGTTKGGTKAHLEARLAHFYDVRQTSDVMALHAAVHAAAPSEGAAVLSEARPLANDQDGGRLVDGATEPLAAAAIPPGLTWGSFAVTMPLSHQLARVCPATPYHHAPPSRRPKPVPPQSARAAQAAAARAAAPAAAPARAAPARAPARPTDNSRTRPASASGATRRTARFEVASVKPAAPTLRKPPPPPSGTANAQKLGGCRSLCPPQMDVQGIGAAVAPAQCGSMCMGSCAGLDFGLECTASPPRPRPVSAPRARSSVGPSATQLQIAAVDEADEALPASWPPSPAIACAPPMGSPRLPGEPPSSPELQTDAGGLRSARRTEACS